MKMSRLAVLCVACVLVLFVGSAAAQDDGWRTIEFETTEVTAPDIAVSPMMLYKGVRKSLPVIAQELDVDAVVEGSVLHAGGRVRINAKGREGISTAICGPRVSRPAARGRDPGGAGAWP